MQDEGEKPSAERDDRARSGDVRRGASVAQIASAAYPKDTADKAEAKVRSLLEQWVELKHRLAAEAAAGEDRPLARRCAEEGVRVSETDA